jgi:hypothetical protein
VSFFDDEGPTPPSATRERRPPRGSAPRPRRPQPIGGHRQPETHALMVRRRIAAGVGVLLVIAIVLIVNAILQGQKTSALEQYNRNVNQIAHQSEQEVAKPLFSALVGAGGKPTINVDQQINELHGTAQQMVVHAREMSVPGEASEAQRNLLLALEFRAEAVEKIAALMSGVLGSEGKAASTHIAGAMEILLASDVVWSQRVRPLTQEALAAGGLHGLSTAESKSLPNVGWLTPETVLSRITGKSSGESSSGQLAPGTHGDALTGLAVGGVTLQAEPAQNNLTGGANPTFTLTFVNDGENPETNTKVVVSVTSAGKTVSASHTVEKTEAGQTYNVNLTVKGVTTGVPAKVEAKVEGVPGESNLENNKASYLAVFE